MIEQLEIKNFRGFSEYKIEDIGQVNLLVGTNNSGKTSVLELFTCSSPVVMRRCYFPFFPEEEKVFKKFMLSLSPNTGTLTGGLEPHEFTSMPGRTQVNAAAR